MAVDRLSVARARRDYLEAPLDYQRNYLTEEEWETFSGLRVNKRKFEWLAARVVAKKLVCRTIESVGTTLRPEQLSIRNVEHGRRKGKPLLVSHVPAVNQYVSDISLTHSPNWAMCVLTRQGRVGVDVERCMKLPPALGYTVFTDRERKVADSVLRGISRRHRLSVLWSVKESLLKAYGVGFSLGWGTARLAAHQRKELLFEVSLPASESNGCEFGMTYGFFENQVFACTLIEQKFEQIVHRREIL